MNERMKLNEGVEREKMNIKTKVAGEREREMQTKIVIVKVLSYLK